MRLRLFVLPSRPYLSIVLTRWGLPHDCSCQLCDNVFNEPVQTPCQHVFCRAGITEKLLAGAWSCPTCSRDVTTAQLKPPSKAIVDYHDALRLRCSNWSSGCRVTTPIREMVEHEEDCAYGTISCMNEGCEVSMLRKDEHAHSDVCAYQQLVCECPAFVRNTLSSLTQHRRLPDRS